MYVSSSNVADGVWDTKITNTTNGENLSPELSWSSVEGALGYEVYMIDTDSIQIGNLPCPVGTEEFTDPALWGQNFSGFLRKLKDEDYSIAMLVFSILFCGLHPYATRMGAETLREEILEKNFPYLLDNSSDEHIPRGGYNYIWEYLPENTKLELE